MSIQGRIRELCVEHHLKSITLIVHNNVSAVAVPNINHPIQRSRVRKFMAEMPKTLTPDSIDELLSDGLVSMLQPVATSMGATIGEALDLLEVKLRHSKEKEVL